MKVRGRVVWIAAVAVLATSALALAGEAGEKAVAEGKVTAVSDKVVTVASRNGEVWTFQVTQGTRVYGQGASHKSQLLVANGRKKTLDQFVREGQHVIVHYRDEDGTRYLTQLHVL